MLGALTMAKERDEKYITISGSDLVENPVVRLARMIREVFWPNLTRRLDGGLIDKAAVDPKDWTDDPRPRIYVPPGATDQVEYYRRLARERPELNLDVEVLPAEITLDVYRQLSRKPGVLALEMEEFVDPATGKKDLRGLPFIVPGGRFNELYNWDSYFTSIGLLNCGMADMAKSIVKNFIFEIRHYGLICNANRSYYILRSQPPFLTDLAWKTYTAIKNQPDAKEFLRFATLAAIKEYTQVWTAEPRYHPKSGLSRYDTKNSGIPLECEDGAFEKILQPYMSKHGLGYHEFIEAFNNGSLKEEALDEYFRHDRAVRESGHDISLRVEGICADIATVDLNCLLYKYETDIARILRTEFDGKLDVPAEYCPAGIEPHAETATAWEQKAELRKKNMIKHMWSEEKGMFVDYNTRLEKHHPVEAATFLWPLWCGVASPEHATRIVANLPKFEMVGGLVSTNPDSLPNKGNMPCHRKHQWDYPSGWAPHQMLAWEGLRRYGYEAEAERLCYKWMHNIIKVFVDFNGAVVEKYDVTNERDPHKVDAEYGNQGVAFKGYAREG
jgi:alpha,alpha-trehalase